METQEKLEVDDYVSDADSDTPSLASLNEIGPDKYGGAGSGKRDEDDPKPGSKPWENVVVDPVMLTGVRGIKYIPDAPTV